MAIEAVIFDLGNVLIDFDHRPAAEKISRFCDKDPEGIYGLFFDSEVTRLFEQGKISPQDFFLRVKEMLDLKIDYDRFLSIWNGIFFLSDKNRSVYRLAKSLKKSYRTAVLSNVNVLHFEYVKKNFAIFDAFHSVITSFESGVTKPDPLIYEKALEVLSVSSAASVFYTDDRPELVAKSRELGIRGFVFQDASQLRRDLENAGVTAA